MKWTAIFYSENGRKPVLEYIGSLEPKAEAKVLRNVAILFSVLSGRIILLTTAFGKKTRKIPNKEIELAAHRLQKYWEENRK